MSLLPDCPRHVEPALEKARRRSPIAEDWRADMERAELRR
jgi:hypothetical protein